MANLISEQVDRRTRLFQMLHQDDDPERYRAEGDCLCLVCGLPYRVHPCFDEYIYNGVPIDHRLCNGDVVHL
jgi:hypothetical protein